MSLLGYEIRKATAHTKVMNLSSNIISVIVFSLGGSVMFLYGAVMAAGTDHRCTHRFGDLP
jgi:uncharacterized membrane protein YfcA